MLHVNKFDKNEMYVLRSLAVDANFFRKIESIPAKLGISDYFVKYEVKKKTGSNTYSSYEELNGCDNLFERKVKAVRLDVFSSKGVKEGNKWCPYRITDETNESAFFIRIEIEWQLQCPKPHSTMKIYLGGSEEKLNIIKDELDYQIHVISRSAIYTVVVRTLPVICLLLTAWMTNAFIRVFGLPEKYDIPLLGEPAYTYKTIFWPTVSVVIHVCCVTIPMYMAALSAFPKICFLFGDRLNREKASSKIKANIIWCIFIGIAVGIISGAILNYYTQIFSGFDLVEFLKQLE